MDSSLNTSNGPMTVTTQVNTDLLPVSPTFHQTFLKGQPKVLGAVQIPLGCVHFAMGTIVLLTLSAFSSHLAWSFIGYWGGLFFIVSGSVTVAAAEKASHLLIRWALITNVISVSTSITEVALAIYDLAFPSYNIYGPCYKNPCSLFQDTIYVIQFISNLLLLFISAFQCCVSLSIVVFSVRSLKDKPPNNQQGLTMQNDFRSPVAFSIFNASLSTFVTDNSISSENQQP